MITYAPTWALGAQAIDAAGDPHLAPGVHLRLQPGAALGLPIFPFRVFRINLGVPGQSPRFRNDGVRFVDAKHQTLVPPFAVGPDYPVTAYLPAPADGVCCWIEIVADAGTGGLRTEAQVAGERGPTTLATAITTPTNARYQMAASRIDRVLITGQGVVKGALWVDGSVLGRTISTDLWRVLSLPLGVGPALYTPALTALPDANARVQRGAPRRPPMYRAAGASAPSQAPLYLNSGAIEKTRIDAASPRARAWLSGLVSGGSTPPGQRLAQSATATAKPVQMSMSLLDAVWLATLDPGLSRWAGFGDVDEAPLGAAGSVVAYVVKGIWQAGLGKASDAELQLLPAPARIDTLAALDMAKEHALANPPLAKPPFFELFSVACATLGRPGLAPQPPVIESFEYKPFMPAVPPAARREVVLCAKGFAPGPGAALVRVAGGVAVSLNPVIQGQTVGLVVSSPQDGGPPGRGRLSDRQAPAESVQYRLAQADWFGRWSAWSQDTATDAKRPRPPRPVLQLGYEPPDAALWGETDSLPGKFVVMVPLPDNDSLAPGSWPLASLKVLVGATPATAVVADVNIKGNLVLKVTGPALPACGSTTVTVTAQWVDTKGQLSEPSLPVVRTIHDPRAPEPVTLDYALGYASRPDATGKARIDLRWAAAGAQQRFRVYYASETILMSRLAQTQPGLLAGLQNIAALPDRAQWFKDNKKAFQRDWFELLNREPLERGNATEMRWVHEVSGKLATLGFYRVASVSAANVENGFDSAPLVAFAVPNTSPPALPLLEVKLNAASGVASLLLRVPRSGASAAHFRLRRTTGSATDATQMRVLQQGPWVDDPAEGATPMQQMRLTDNTLKPWRRYCWRAEVRGADLPGSTLKGAWSRASATVEAVVLPATPPQPVSQLKLNQKGQAFVISIQHDPLALQGGTVGRFRLDLYKHVPGGREAPVDTLWADTPAAQGGFDTAGHFSFVDEQPAPKGTVYRVLVTDPLGRVSASNPSVTVP
jgi:hypothetical protein